jgi:orotidine-5'-phosphate decarboxylase
MSINKVFIAFDQMTDTEIEHFIKISGQKFTHIKIGLELFLKYGPKLIHNLYSKYQVSIFLDLKLHDIPVTVAKSIESLKDLPICFLTIHMAGGKHMIEHALISAAKFLPKTQLLGVSYLTSLSDEDSQKVFGFDLNSTQFERMFHLALETKIHGIVCSPKEIGLLKKISPQTLCVTPGVRFQSEIDENSNFEDQKRILSINEAFQNGADYVVMGRSLTKCKSDLELNNRINLIDQL